MALVKHSVLMAKSYCISIFKVSYNVPIINIVLRFIMFYYYCFYVQPLCIYLKIVCRKINKNEMKMKGESLRPGIGLLLPAHRIVSYPILSHPVVSYCIVRMSQLLVDK